MLDVDFPFKKGEKYWIEIEAIEDGELIKDCSNISKMVFRDSIIDKFQVNQLIVKRDYFNTSIVEDLNDIKNFIDNKIDIISNNNKEN